MLKRIAQEKGKEGVVVERKEAEAEKGVAEVEKGVAEVEIDVAEVRAEEAEVNNVIDLDQEIGIGDQGPETEDLSLDHNLVVEIIEVGIERVNIIENQRRKALKLQ